MKDLLLWQRLLGGFVDAEETISLLEQLSRLPLADRWPYLGLMSSGLQHYDPRLRAAAIACCAGASGTKVWQWLARGLEDPEPLVRLAAVEALRKSAVDDPARWVHALFHADVNVRMAAADGQQPSGADQYAVHLFSDPHCRDLIQAHLDEGRLPPSAIGPLLLHVNSGFLAPSAARRIIWQIARRHPVDWAKELAHRGIPQALMTLRNADDGDEQAVAASITYDAFDLLFDLFWDEEESEFQPQLGTSPARDFRSRLLSQLLAAGLPMRVFATASLLIVAARRGAWRPWAAQLCAVLHSNFLTYSWVPFDVRHSAVRGLYDAGSRSVRRDDAQVRRLLAADICFRPSGHLDLWAIGGILHLANKHPYKLLQEVHSSGRIVESFLEDMQYAAPFLRHRDKSDVGRSFLIGEICKRRRPKRSFLFALLICSLAADGLDFLDDIDGAMAVDVAEQLFALLEKPENNLSEGKRRIVSQVLGAALAPAHTEEFLQLWLKRKQPHQSAVALDVVTEIVRRIDADDFAAMAVAMPLKQLRKLLDAIPYCAGFPFGKELYLARTLQGHADNDVANWAAARAMLTASSRPMRPSPPESASELTDEQVAQLAMFPNASLSGPLEPCLLQPRRRLCEALDRRRRPVQANVQVAAALLACRDSLGDTDAMFCDFASDEPAFLNSLDQLMVQTWLHRDDISPLGHAWLHRWEKHLLALAESLRGSEEGIANWLRVSLNLRSGRLSGQMWEAVAHLLAVWRFRDGPALAKAATEKLVALAAEQISSPLGLHAARILMAVYHHAGTRPRLDAVRSLVIEKLPDTSDDVRRTINDWIDTRGLTAATTSRAKKSSDSSALLAEISASDDLDHLQQLCCHDNTTVSQEAAMRLIMLGEPGIERILAALRISPPVAGATLMASSLALWPPGRPLELAAEFVADNTCDAELRFLLGAELLDRNDGGDFNRAQVICDVMDAACQPAETAWFRSGDWKRLCDAGIPVVELSCSLAKSPHPHAYGPSVENLLPFMHENEWAKTALESFLHAGSNRLHQLRVRVACELLGLGNYDAFPILLSAYCSPRSETSSVPHNLLNGTSRNVFNAALFGILAAGQKNVPEKTLLTLLENGDALHEDLKQIAYEKILEEATYHGTRDATVQLVRKSPMRTFKLRQVARAFNWGVRIGRELTGRLFTVHLLAGEDLGYTRLEENKIYINGLPVLRQERNGRQVVEALILHEYGHHMYHRGRRAQEVWKETHKEGLGQLLNLVSDEHLERNLRALDAAFGDRLKRLAAYAFQHSKREVEVDSLLASLGGRAADVLIAARLRVARKPGCVMVENGQVLLEMERLGVSFARFVRAMRMGLGNRHGDPKVAEALKLFKGKFRRSTMDEMAEIARKLRDIFGSETDLLDVFGQDAALRGDAGELLVHGEGITEDEISNEVQRIEDEEQLRKQGDGSDGRGGLCINVSANEDFNTITSIEKMPFDAAAHAALADPLARHARRLRQFLRDLGLAAVPVRRRMRGHTVDRTRIRAAVLRGDPRLLVAREHQVHSDLFIGVVIDCSGSMWYDDNLRKAKAFGSLVAEACRGLPGVDLRLFGFTDHTIYDCGDALRPALHALEPGGGNNDAAALWHAGQLARKSIRKAKLLVMISDGLPTECSVDALRGLVSRLSLRMKICCAQVAVRDLDEVCFPHYILLDEGDLDNSVRKFGRTVARLVKRAMGIRSS